jgi:hypothetical protein
MANDERNGGGSRGDRGRDDAPDDFGGPEDETVVIVSGSYTLAAVGRLADGLRGVVALCDWLREGGTASSVAERIAALGELAEKFGDVSILADGTKRAVARLKAEEEARLRGP